jgi:protein-disulfide isomerase
MRFLRTSFLVLLAASCLGAADAPAPKQSVFDKAYFETYVRHLFVWDQQVKVEIGDPKHSTRLPGFDEISVHASQGPATQDETFLVSHDGRKFFRATIFDITQNPFKEELDKIKTGFQPSFGTPGATVVIVLFTDFECPYCRAEAKMLRDNLLSAFPKQVRVYFQDFPLEQIHPWALPAAIAGRCVFRQSPLAFWKYHDWIYEHQGEITPQNLQDKVMEFAKANANEIDALQLERCMSTRATASEVEKSIAEGRSLGVNSTPTMFVNGRRLPGQIDWMTLRRVIENEIEYQRTARNAGEDCGCEVKIPSLNSSLNP